MHVIVKVPETSRIRLDASCNRLISHCYKHAFIEKNVFIQCCNSTYIITKADDMDSFLGLIACRRIKSTDIHDHNLMKYHPQRYHAIYKIEALHYDKSVPLEKRAELIETCLRDKNDSFVILECKCQNVIADIEFLQSLGFDKGYYANKKTVLVRAPRLPLKRTLKSLFKKDKFFHLSF